MTTSSRIVVLVSGKSVRRYPLPDGVELKDSYTLDGRAWTVTAVLTTEDVPMNGSEQFAHRSTQDVPQSKVLT